MTSPLHTQGGESAPTPTPWKVQGNFIGGEVAAIVEMAQSSLTTYEEKRANLALIVQAVNERPALLAQAAHHSAQLEKALGRIAQLEGALRSAKADAHAHDHGSYDPDTGATEFSRAGEDYYNTLRELADEIRALNKSK